MCLPVAIWRIASSGHLCFLRDLLVHCLCIHFGNANIFTAWTLMRSTMVPLWVIMLRVRRYTEGKGSIAELTESCKLLLCLVFLSNAERGDDCGISFSLCGHKISQSISAAKWQDFELLFHNHIWASLLHWWSLVSFMNDWLSTLSVSQYESCSFLPIKGAS